MVSCIAATAMVAQNARQTLQKLENLSDQPLEKIVVELKN
jgi:hypothetical protein